MTARQRGRRRWPFAAGGAILLALMIGAGIAVATGLFDGEADHTGRAGGVAVSGDRDQWTAAVCADDSDLATSSNFLYPDAKNIAYCATKTSADAESQPVVIGEWPRDADLEADIARLETVKWFATATVGDHMTVFILLDSSDRTLLEPLSPFGFTVRAPG